MNRMIAVGIVAFLSVHLSGCVSSVIEQGLVSLVGKDARAAIDVLGNPSGKQQSGHETVYYWSVAQSGSYITPRPSVYKSTPYNETVSYDRTCLIKLTADENERIIKSEYAGNAEACARYAERLSEYQKSLSR